MADTKAMQRLKEIERRIYESTPELLPLSKKKAKPANAFKESRPQTSGSVKKRRDIRDPHSNAVDLQNAVLDLQAQLEKERQENTRMKLDIEKRQERYVRREQEYRRTILDYEEQLRIQSSSVPLSLGDQANKNISKIAELQEKVLENIGYIQHKTSRILQTQEEDIVKQFNSKLTIKERELEEEKRRKLDGVGNFAEKEDKLIREMELMKASIEFIETKNKKLSVENQELRVQFKSQETDRDTLLRQIVQLKREMTTLKEELAKYKEGPEPLHIEELSVEKPDISMRSMSNRKGSANVGEESMNRYEQVINRLKKMIELERKNLRAARTAHAKELESRTELEQLLRRCVDDVKQEIQRRRTEQRQRSRDQELTAADREKIIEVLLSQERVLTLLYDKTFPPRVLTREGGFGETEPHYGSSLAHIDHNIQSLHEMYDDR
jgi:regulator of replication initiation timing